MGHIIIALSSPGIVTTDIAPILACESPGADGAIYVHNQIHVRGHARGAERVVVELGELTADASVGMESPALRSRLPNDPGADRQRFELTLPTAGCSRGIHTLNVVAVLASGGELRSEQTITVEPYDPPGEATPAAIRAGAIVMSCDTPKLGGADEVSSPVRISGWCYARSGVDRVQAFIDGNRRFDLVFPGLRRDVWEFFGLRDALLSGFDLLLDIEDCPPGTHSLSVLATTTDGRTVGQSGTFMSVEAPAATPVNEWLPAEHVEPRTQDDPLGNDGRDVAERYADRQTAVERRARYSWAAPLAAGRTVLDAACGSGDGTAILVRAGAARVVGVDVSKADLASARFRAGAAAEFLAADLCSLPFAEDEFDLVVCFDALERLPQRAQALDELRRVLRTNGVLLVSSRDKDVLSELRARWMHVRRWGQQTFVTAVIGELEESTLGEGELRLDADLVLSDPLPGRRIGFVVAGASDVSVPDIPGIAILDEDAQIHAILDELDHVSLRAHVAEKHAIVSTLESDVIQRYHQELLRSHSALKSELAACMRARDAEQARAAAAERWLQNHRRSFSWQVTRPLRAAKGIGRRTRPK